MSRMRVFRRCAAAAVIAGAVGPGTAVAVAIPSVSATLYSQTVSGAVGTPTSDVAVTVKLLRAGTAVATAPVATTDAAGTWTATLPGRAPSSPQDVIEVDYAGAGAPAVNARYPLQAMNGFAATASVMSGGGQVSVDCSPCANAPISVHVAYADGTSHDVSTSSVFPSYSTAVLTPAVGTSDIVTFTAPMSVP